eukprot:TRINITY_DN6175_c0_g1_i1.p1 TRINITY_DN6175_c0_g1~~TRINITY_DN6175_c0_g1_i1.p1  ORF type:complete len:458 (+),score=83.86 TRINITY_DN6175_c0_g1_i1:54-1427(+)
MEALTRPTDLTPELYKAMQEEWVSGLTGGSLGEVLLVMCAGPVVTLFQRAVSSYRQQETFLVDYLTLIAPLVLVMSFPQYIVPLYISLISLSLLLLKLSGTGWRSADVDEKATQESEPKLANDLHFLTNFRTLMMMMTCIAILAVDFSSFPRRFAKSEHYGISVMDLGVAGFVFSMALVSPSARGIASPSFFRRMKGVMKTMFPSLILGAARFFAVKASDYQQHVSEYGVHWNFFVTLAFVALLSAIVNPNVQFSAVYGLTILLNYQFALTMLGYEDYILNAPRLSFLSMNKEGIASCFGFTAIFLIGSQVGFYLNLFVKKRKPSSWYQLVIGLLVTALGFYIAGVVTEYHFEIPPSRKLANATYVFYAVSTSLVPLALLLLIDVYVLPKNTVLTNSISRRRHMQLITFLSANLLTGAINLSMYTLFAPFHISVDILFLYTFVVSAWAVTFPKYVPL